MMSDKICDEAFRTLITAFQTLEWAANKYSSIERTDFFYQTEVLNVWKELLANNSDLNALQQISGFTPPPTANFAMYALSNISPELEERVTEQLMKCELIEI